jgi:NADPH-dependent curcumin reductase CurA
MRLCTDNRSDVRSYIPPVEVGAVMRGGGVGRVTKSKSQNFPVGSLVYGGIGWAEYAVLPDTYPQLAIVKVPEGGQITDALGVLGMTGMTAYHGMVNIGQVKKGDLVVVSGAAGATGSVAGQIAKIMGGTVVGLAGSDEKVAWLKELGYDFALNYKDADFSQKFKEVTKVRTTSFSSGPKGQRRVAGRERDLKDQIKAWHGLTGE